MKDHAKVGRKKGRSAFRTPSKFAIRKKKHLRRPSRLKGKSQQAQAKKK